jgi:hypothetical protein
VARIKGDRQTLAESLLRATRTTMPATDPWTRAWTDGVLTQCLLAQERITEALDASVGTTLGPPEGVVDPRMAAEAGLAVVDALIVGGRVFDAGQRCSELRAAIEATGDGPARVSVALAGLRVATAAGDMACAAARLTEAIALARTHHGPLVALEARLTWVGLLWRGGRVKEARLEQRRLLRASRAAPALLRRRIEAACASAAPAVPESDVAIRDTAVALVRLADEASDQVSLERMTGRLLLDLRASRIDIQAGDGRPAPLVTSGTGLIAKSAARAIEAGMAIGPEASGGAYECAAPIRTGERTIAALACRWPVGRPAPPASRAALEIAAAIAAPRGRRFSSTARMPRRPCWRCPNSWARAPQWRRSARPWPAPRARRVGESFSRHVDVRIVAATNRSMSDGVAAGQFRRDLLYRLDVIRIRIPPLRERPGDVALLARHFWAEAAARAGTRAVLSHGVLAALARYHWPGNVRELQNVVASLAVAAPSRGAVRAELLPAAVTTELMVAPGRLADARVQFERRFVEIALARAGGNRARAASEIGLSRQGLLKLLARLEQSSVGRRA